MLLLDTNHCSHIMARDEAVLKQLAANAHAGTAISVISEGELFYMAERSERRDGNLIRVREFLDGVRIYSINSTTAEIYGRLKRDIFERFAPKEKAKRRHITTVNLGFDDNDLWIAAVALQHGLTVVSHDDDFVRMKTVSSFSLMDWISGTGL